jgi:hypothetical protein
MPMPILELNQSGVPVVPPRFVRVERSAELRKLAGSVNRQGSEADFLALNRKPIAQLSVLSFRGVNVAVPELSLESYQFSEPLIPGGTQPVEARSGYGLP